MTGTAFPARGLTLIEVLVSMLVLSLGIFGAIGMQARLQQAAVESGQRARASMLADEMAAMMWAHRSVDIATVDAAFYRAWRAHVASPSASGLPAGSGSVTLDPSRTIATIKVSWNAATPPASGRRPQFVTAVEIP